jgi:hypothetical protein
MKPGLNRVSLRFILLSIIIIFILIFFIVLIPWGEVVSLTLQGLKRFLYRFDKYYRVEIAYISAFILLIGVFILLLKNLFFTGILGKWLKGISTVFLGVYDDYKKKWAYKKIKSPIYILLIFLSILFFYILPFSYAFIFAAFVFIYLFQCFKEDKKKLLLFSIAIIFLFWSPYLFQGQDVHVKIFDNLDSHIAHTKVLAESGKAFSLDPNTRLDNFLNGIALSGVDSGYNILTWLFILFPPFIAYALNDLLIRLVAFGGMILLLKKYIIKIKTEGEEYDWIIIGSSLCFALLPFYPAGGLSIAGIPILLYAFLNILNHSGKFTDFLIIFIFPFYSKLALAGFFITIALAILFIIDGIKKRKINFPYLGGLVLLTVTYIFTHFHLVYSFIGHEFVTYREEITARPISTAKAIKETLHNFIFDRVNEVSAQHLFVVGAAALAVLVSIVKKLKAKLLSGLIAIIFFTAILWGFKYWENIHFLREKYQLLNAFDVSRFYWINQFLWYVVFAVGLIIISKIKKGKLIASLFIVLQVLFLFINYNWEYRHLLGIKGSYAGSRRTYSLTYRAFYSESLFEEIHRFINKPKKDYRVVSLGIPPAISQYNGFYTLDIYTDIYPLEYKHKFRRIIEKELAKNPRIKRTFDENAKRCYLLPSELSTKGVGLGKLFTSGITKKEGYIKIKNLELNTAALKEMGGEYIFSAVEILNYAETGLSFEKAFETSDSPWKIYLYKVN